MTVGTEIAKNVTDLLNRHARVLQISRSSGDSYDPSAGSLSGGSTETQDISAVVVGYKDRYIDETVIKRGDRKVYVGSKDPNGYDLAIGPKIGDKITGLPEDANVLNVKRIESSGDLIAFVCQVRE